MNYILHCFKSFETILMKHIVYDEHMLHAQNDGFLKMVHDLNK